MLCDDTALPRYGTTRFFNRFFLVKIVFVYYVEMEGIEPSSGGGVFSTSTMA